MHRSRLGVVVVDHAESHDAALRFWAAVTGSTPSTSQDGPEYTSLDEQGPLSFFVQRTGAGTPARAHLDIESDDVAAEVARVVALGARLVDEHGKFAVLEDPGGMVFCVVPVQSRERFDAHARTWH